MRINTLGAQYKAHVLLGCIEIRETLVPVQYHTKTGTKIMKEGGRWVREAAARPLL